jgi:hypothetical protein
MTPSGKKQEKIEGTTAASSPACAETISREGKRDMLRYFKVAALVLLSERRMKKLLRRILCGILGHNYIVSPFVYVQCARCKRKRAWVDYFKEVPEGTLHVIEHEKV